MIHIEKVLVEIPISNRGGHRKCYKFDVIEENSDSIKVKCQCCGKISSLPYIKNQLSVEGLLV